jgi:oxygen-dependent protoporphyrinogen oxidase
MTGERRTVVVVGAGITGLSAAHALADHHDVVVIDAAERTGGKLAASAFAGLPSVDEGADAYLMRVPHATALVRQLGFDTHDLVHPATSHASIWHTPRRGPGRLFPLPEGLLLGVPTGARALARSGLVSHRGVARAATEPLRPRRSAAHDTLGRWVRDRLGDEVHELLVDPLVGSIYAADTDRFSLATVAQLADLANERSLVLAARRRRRSAAATGPVFEAPRQGMASLAQRLETSLRHRGVSFVLGRGATHLGREGTGYQVDDIAADAVIVATPARAMSQLLTSVAPTAAAHANAIEAASVIMVTAAVPGHQWRPELTGSGYLVPKPDQRFVTAASFASNKWAHWRPDDGSMVLRISLGRDGVRLDDWDDDRLISTALTETSHHLGVDLTPSQVRLTRWVESFPQYRPGHVDRVGDMERELHQSAPGVAIAGASLRGMGVPACVHQGHTAAARVSQYLTGLAT